MDTKQRLMKEARELFARKGFDGVSVREIAEAAGANVGAVSYYFDGKENLYREIVHDGIGEMKTTLAEIIAEDMPMRDRTELLFEAFLEFLMGEESVSRMIFAELALGGERLPEMVGDHFMQMMGIIRGFIREGIKNGEIVKCDDTLVFFSFASLPAYLVFARPIVEMVRGERGYSKAFVKKVARHHARVLFDGLGKD